MGIRKNILQLNEDLYKNHKLLQKQNLNQGEITNNKEIKKVNPSELYKYIGKQKLLKRTEFTQISNKSSPLLEELLQLEKQICLSYPNKVLYNHVTIREIHNFYSTKARLITFSMIYLLPTIFIIKGSRMSSMTYSKYLFFLPLIFATKEINEGIKQYVTRKYAIPMLFCIDKYYIDKPEFYSKYKMFMNENNLEFKSNDSLSNDKNKLN
jgi:hypothetical protein